MAASTLGDQNVFRSTPPHRCQVAVSRRNLRRATTQAADLPNLPAEDTAPILPSVRFRVVVSLLVLWHLWAVVGEPVEFITRLGFGIEGSPAGMAFNRPVRPYAQFTYLSHGYAFFAPDPGPSHLLEARWQQADGTSQQLRFPDLQRQRPRLLYHRHFMLTEFLNNVHTASLPEGLREDEQAETRAWKASREQYVAIRDSYRRHLGYRLQVPWEEIELHRIAHRAPFVPEYLDQGVRLQDQRLFTELPDTLEGLDNTLEGLANGGEPMESPQERQQSFPVPLAAPPGENAFWAQREPPATAESPETAARPGPEMMPAGHGEPILSEVGSEP